jgi:hypothetical protein
MVGSHPNSRHEIESSIRLALRRLNRGYKPCRFQWIECAGVVTRASLPAGGTATYHQRSRRRMRDGPIQPWRPVFSRTGVDRTCGILLLLAEILLVMLKAMNCHALSNHSIRCNSAQDLFLRYKRQDSQPLPPFFCPNGGIFVACFAFFFLQRGWRMETSASDATNPKTHCGQQRVK